MKRKRVQELPDHERPREKLHSRGVGALSDRELIAVILGRGSQKAPLLELADQVLALLDRNGGQPDPIALAELPGLGPARASQLSAAIELARRRVGHAGIRIKTAAEILPLVRHYADRRQEHFLCISLNGNNEVLANRVITIGLLDRGVVHPREVFAEPIAERAASVIVAHNHPSGTAAPSKADIATTRRLVEAGDLLGIPVLDHIIFTHGAYYSFAEQGCL